jgi:hypothetical protein
MSLGQWDEWNEFEETEGLDPWNRSTMGAIPRFIDSTHVLNDSFHLSARQGLSNHDMNGMNLRRPKASTLGNNTWKKKKTKKKTKNSQ